MLDLLSKLVGPHRAVSIYVFIQNRGLILLAAIAFLAIIGLLFLSANADEHKHQAYLTLPVISTTPVGTDIANGIFATMRLPNGENLTVTTTEGEVAATVAATACVEHRVFTKTGEPRYRLKLPHYCAGN